MTARSLFAVLAAALVAPVAVRADDEKPKKPAEPGGKPLIIQLDASKLPPELLKELLKLAKPADEPKFGALGVPLKPSIKPEKPAAPEKPAIKSGTPDKPTVKPEKPTKVIGLTDAIAIAEKTTQGMAVRAERKGDAFVVDVQTKGGKSSVTVDANGKVAGDKKSEKEGEKGDKKKDGDKDEGKGKKKDDDDDKEKKGKKKDDDDKDEGKGKKGKKDD